MTSGLTLDEVSVSYETKRGAELEVIRKLSLHVAGGEFVAVVGPTGCGKSSLLRVICGLLPTSHGEVLFDGQSLSSRVETLGFVFQSAALLPWKSALENIRFGLASAGMDKKRSRSRAREYLNLVGLKDFEDAYPNELSGGMQQRVNLARALAVHPNLMLLDEPFAALDAQTREQMQSELLRVWQAEQRTALFVTHQIDEGLFLADKVVVLSSRPAVIKDVVVVPFPRPRNMSIKRSPEFQQLHDRVWTGLGLGATAADPLEGEGAI